MAVKGKHGSGPGLHLSKDGVKQLRDSIELLTKRRLLVGFPEDKSQRTKEDSDEPDVTNAALGYIHDNGAPEQNIPARPFMIPGMTDATPKVIQGLTAIAKKLGQGGTEDAVDKGYERVGRAVVIAIKSRINDGIPPPLAESTLLARAHKGDQGAMWELSWRWAGAPPGVGVGKPLVVTGQMRNAITFVIRPKGKGD